jgi:hypothetical protein
VKNYQIICYLLKPIIEGNKIINESDHFSKKFSLMSFSGNRPSKRLWNDFDPFLYSCGNTFAINMLDSVAQSERKKYIYDIYLGGCCDIRHLIETVYKSVLIRNEISNEDKNIFNFVLNDVNITNLARIVLILYVIEQSILLKNIVTIEKIQGESAMFIADLLMLWTSPGLYAHQKVFLNKVLSELEGIFKSINLVKKKLPWLVLLENESEGVKMIEKLQIAFGLWKKYSYDYNTIEFHGLTKRISQSDFQNLLTNYLHVDTLKSKNLPKLNDLLCLHNGNLIYSTSILNYSATKYETKMKINEVNTTLFTIPTLDLNVYETSCLFRSFEVDYLNGNQPEQSTEKVYDHYFDKLIDHMSERFKILSLILSNKLDKFKINIL